MLVPHTWGFMGKHVNLCVKEHKVPREEIVPPLSCDYIKQCLTALVLLLSCLISPPCSVSTQQISPSLLMLALSPSLHPTPSFISTGFDTYLWDKIHRHSFVPLNVSLLQRAVGDVTVLSDNKSIVIWSPYCVQKPARHLGQTQTDY